MNGKILPMGEPMGLFIAEETGKLGEVNRFSSSIAGAEYNVALGLIRLGHEAAYCTRLGKDPFGEKILAALNENGISADLVVQDEEKLTGFMMKSQVESGDPAISYFRKNSAASAMTAHDVDKLDLYGCEWLHLTGITPALSDSMYGAVKRLIARADTLEMFISFDPNLRPMLWESEAKMVSVLNELAKSANLVLPGVNEGRILAGTENPREIAEFYHNMGVHYVIVKLGADGAYYSEKGKESGQIPAFPVNKIVDTVGAGDGFAAGVISALAEGISLKEAAERGAVIGSVQISNKSDNEGLPSRSQLEDIMEKGIV